MCLIFDLLIIDNIYFPEFKPCGSFIIEDLME